MLRDRLDSGPTIRHSERSAVGVGHSAGVTIPSNAVEKEGIDTGERLDVHWIVEEGLVVVDLRGDGGDLK